MAGKGAEIDDFSGGDENSTVLDFSDAVAPPTFSGGVAASRIALSGGGAVTKKKKQEVSRSVKEKPIFVKNLFHRAFHALDKKVRLSKQVESILATTVLKSLQRIVETPPPHALDLYTINAVMANVFGMDIDRAQMWREEEHDMLESITNHGNSVMVHNIFLKSVLQGRKVNARKLDKDSIFLPICLLTQFKADAFDKGKLVTADAYFRTLMIVQVVRMVRRIYAYLKLTKSNTVTVDLIKSISMHGVRSRPLPDESEKAAWRKANGVRRSAAATKKHARVPTSSVKRVPRARSGSTTSTVRVVMGDPRRRAKATGRAVKRRRRK